MKRITPLALTALSVLLSFLPSTLSAQSKLKMGQPFPHLTFQDLNGRPVQSLSQYRGKKILLLNFASW